MMSFVKCVANVVMAVSAVIATSCVKDVTLDAMEEPTVVVDCVLTDEPVQTLHLVYTKGASREAAPDLPEATAVLTDLTEGKEAGRFARTADGSWTLAYAAIPEHRYRLDVTVPGHEPIWAEQTMPDPPGLSVRWRRWDPCEQADDIHVPHLSNIGYSFRFLQRKDAVWFYGLDYPERDSAGELTQYLCTDNPDPDPFNIVQDKFYFEPFFEVRDFRERYLWGGSGSSGLRVSCYPGLGHQPLYKEFLRFPAREDALDDEFMVSGSFHGYLSDYKNFTHAEMRPAELHYLSTSEDYDRFLQDFTHLKDIKLSSNLSDIFVRENVYGNVQGAIGLFGAKIERTLDWEGKDCWRANGHFILASAVSAMLVTMFGDDNPDVMSDEEFNGQMYTDLKNGIKQEPFELFHYEYWYDEPRPDWTPEWDYGFHPVEEIRSQEELEAHGLGQYGPIDFSEKKALYCAFQMTHGEFPFLISYGKVQRGPYYNEAEAMYMPVVGIAFCSVGEESLPLKWSAFRFVILVNKEDVVVSEINLNQYCGELHFFTRLSDKITKDLAINTP